jgi:hypothetical protein
MTDMLKGGNNRRFTSQFVPTLVIKESFQQQREAFTKVAVLLYLNPSQLICFKIDASGYAIAVSISQQTEDVCNGAEVAG